MRISGEFLKVVGELERKKIIEPENRELVKLALLNLKIKQIGDLKILTAEKLKKNGIVGIQAKKILMYGETYQGNEMDGGKEEISPHSEAKKFLINHQKEFSLENVPEIFICFICSNIIVDTIEVTCVKENIVKT